MPNKMLVLFTLLTLFPAIGFAAKYQKIYQTKMSVSGNDAETSVENALLDLAGLFDRYRVRLDSTTRLLSPLRRSGSKTKPVIKAKIEKCVFIVCERARLVGFATVREYNGKCDRNWEINLDLARSDRIISDVYDSLQVRACFHHRRGSRATLKLTGYVGKSRAYQSGFTQNTIYAFLKRQVPAVVLAFKKNLARHTRADQRER